MKNIFKISLILILFYSTMYADIKPLTDAECKEIIKTYKIDPKIKSSRGWNHIFQSEKWLQRFDLDRYNDAELNCIKEYILANAMDVNKYNKYVGMEIKL